ncbi:MAG: hypothetical protein GY711_17625 [bacterium]|nr:hypothetical protein [bacterium]
MRMPSLFAGLVFIWFGGTGVVSGLQNLEIVEMSFTDYVREKPGDEWVRLTGVGLDIANASYTPGSLEDTILELIVPLRPANAETRDTVNVMLATSDADMIHEFRKLQKVPEAELEKYYFENVAALFVTAPVEGMVRISFDQERGRKALSKARPDIAPDCAVIGHGAKPESFALSGSMLGLGVLMIVGRFFALRG